MLLGDVLQTVVVLILLARRWRRVLIACSSPVLIARVTRGRGRVRSTSPVPLMVVSKRRVNHILISIPRPTIRSISIAITTTTTPFHKSRHGRRSSNRRRRSPGSYKRRRGRPWGSYVPSTALGTTARIFPSSKKRRPRCSTTTPSTTVSAVATSASLAALVAPPRLVAVVWVLLLVLALLFFGQASPPRLLVLGLLLPPVADDLGDFRVGGPRMCSDYLGLVGLAVEDECCFVG